MVDRGHFVCYYIVCYNELLWWNNCNINRSFSTFTLVSPRHAKTSGPSANATFVLSPDAIDDAVNGEVHEVNFPVKWLHLFF